jgi:signal transduction histidine kinase
LADPHSLGLVGMRERALLLGGETIVTGSPGTGTAVRVRIPLGQP